MSVAHTAFGKGDEDGRDDASTTVGHKREASESEYGSARVAACDALDCDLDYEEKSHLMGRPTRPAFRRRVVRGSRSFCTFSRNSVRTP